MNDDQNDDNKVDQTSDDKGDKKLRVIKTEIISWEIIWTISLIFPLLYERYLVYHDIQAMS